MIVSKQYWIRPGPRKTVLHVHFFILFVFVLIGVLVFTFYIISIVDLLGLISRQSLDIVVPLVSQLGLSKLPHLHALRDEHLIPHSLESFESTIVIWFHLI